MELARDRCTYMTKYEGQRLEYITQTTTKEINFLHAAVGYVRDDMEKVVHLHRKNADGLNKVLAEEFLKKVKADDLVGSSRFQGVTEEVLARTVASGGGEQLMKYRYKNLQGKFGLVYMLEQFKAVMSKHAVNEMFTGIDEQDRFHFIQMLLEEVVSVIGQLEEMLDDIIVSRTA